jgi:excisionase family DNA binding protein
MQTYTFDKELLHVKQAAAELRVHPSTVRRAIHSGELDAVTLGTKGRYRVSRDALEQWLRPVNSKEDNQP